MPKIPLITSQLGQANSAGGSFFQQQGGVVGRSIENLGNTLRGIEEKRSAKAANIATYDAENELMESSRLQYDDAINNKLGKLALPNKETGAKGVYEDYNKFADEFVSKGSIDIDPRYQEAYKQQLTNTADRYRDRFMAHEANQMGEVRKATLNNNITELTDEMSAAMKNGQGVEFINETFAMITKVVELNSHGKDTTEDLHQRKISLYTEAIKASSLDHPEVAQEMLQDKEVKKVLSSETRERLEETNSKHLIKKGTDTALSMIMSQDISTDAKRLLQEELPRDTPEQRAISDNVLREINYQDKIQKDNKARDGYKLLNETYESIVDNDNPPDVNDINSDPKYEILENNQREYLKALLEDPESGKFNDVRRREIYWDTKDRIKMRLLTPRQVRNEALSGVYDIRDADKLVEYSRKVYSGKDIPDDGSDLLAKKYKKIWDDDQKRRDTLSMIETSIETYNKNNNGNDPYGQNMIDIVDHAADQAVDDKGWIFTHRVSRSSLDEADERRIYPDKGLDDLSLLGYPDAIRAPNGDIQLRVEPDGTVLILPRGSKNLETDIRRMKRKKYFSDRGA